MSGRGTGREKETDVLGGVLEMCRTGVEHVGKRVYGGGTSPGGTGGIEFLGVERDREVIEGRDKVKKGVS